MAYSTATCKANKEKYAAKVTKRLAKRRAWRLKKYGDYATEELMRRSLELFAKWGHRKEQCVSTLKLRKYRRPVRKQKR